MEHLTNNETFPFISPHKVSVLEFTKSWAELLTEDLSLLACSNHTERNASDLNIPTKMIKSLEKDLNPNDFCNTVNDEKLLTENISNVAESLELETLKELNLHNERLLTDSTYRMKYCPKYRHDLLDKPAEVMDKLVDSGLSQKPLAVLTVQIFKPAIKNHMNRTRLQLDRELEVLSHQPLTALRDNFICVSDVLSDKDFSENPLEPLPKFTSHEKLGFFFLENVFYKDTRCESTLYVNRLVQWAKEKKIGRFSEKSMQDTSFDQLTIQLGFPYLYMHGNNCEHLLVFTDIRLLVGQSEETIQMYPRCIAQENMQKLKCQMCSMCFSKWVVIDNKRLPTSPFYFCHTCFISFNYDSDLNKRGSFQAYPILFNLDNTL